MLRLGLDRGASITVTSLGRCSELRNTRGLRLDLRGLTCALVCTLALPTVARAQVVRGTVSSAVGSGRVAGAVVLLLDSALTTHARALTSDSGTFAVGVGAAGRFHLKVMRIGFKPIEIAAFDLGRDTTIDIALADIPVVLPSLVTRDRNDCRLHPDTSEAGVTTFALWDQARTAFLAAAITLEQDYRFTKLLHARIYEVKPHALRGIALREVVTKGATPWASLSAEQLRRDGYMAQDDSGLTFYAPDLDVLLSPYFTQEHCFHLATGASPDSNLVGLDFEPASRPRHVEIRGTLWLDRASKELHRLAFSYVNLPGVANDTLLGGNVEFTPLRTGAWILSSWSIRMPTPVRTGFLPTLSSAYEPSTTIRSHGRWRITTDFVRVVGGDVRAVRRGANDDSVLWRSPTGSARIVAFTPSDTGAVPAPGVIVRLAGSPYGGTTGAEGQVRFEQVMPGTYLFAATTPLLDALEAPGKRTVVTVRAGEPADALVRLEPLAKAAAEVCDVAHLDRDSGVLAGHVLHGDDALARVHVSLQWPGGDPSIETRDDGYFRFCNVPVGKLILVKASYEKLMATTTVTLAPNEIVHPLELKLQP